VPRGSPAAGKSLERLRRLTLGSATEAQPWAIDRHYGKDNEYEFGGAMEPFKQVDVRAAENALAEAISAVIQKGQDDGSIRHDVPATLLAQTFHSILKDAAHDEAYKAGTLDVEALKTNVMKLLLG
jgi:hypothetical protein